MKDKDLLLICSNGIKYLAPNKRAFVCSIRKTILRSKKPLTDSQHSYLQNCYDEILQKQYGLEPMAKPHNYWVRKKKDPF